MNLSSDLFKEIYGYCDIHTEINLCFLCVCDKILKINKIYDILIFFHLNYNIDIIGNYIILISMCTYHIDSDKKFDNIIKSICNNPIVNELPIDKHFINKCILITENANLYVNIHHILDCFRTFGNTIIANKLLNKIKYFENL